MTKSMYRKVDGIIITYDLTQQATFDGVANWIESINENAAVDVFKILVGNKVDLEDDRQVSKDHAQKFADKKGLKFFETSAKTKINVIQSIEYLLEQIIALRQPGEEQDEKKRVHKSLSLEKFNRVKSADKRQNASILYDTKYQIFDKKSKEIKRSLQSISSDFNGSDKVKGLVQLSK